MIDSYIPSQLSQPKEVTNAVDAALRAGYRHIDAAAIYENETEVGEGWKRSGVPREEIFVNTYSQLFQMVLDVNVL